MYSEVKQWPSWMTDFRFGTLAFLPEGWLRSTVDNLREQYDSKSAQTSPAHITLTQPFSKAPSPHEIQLVENVFASKSVFDIQVGPVTTSPNKQLIWLDVSPKDPILSLREALHGLGIFRTDLPLTKGFIPHMTISELRRDPLEVEAINRQLNSDHPMKTVIKFDKAAWIVPDDNFVFKIHSHFNLRS